MKIKTRPTHASMLQINDSLTGLRDGERARPAGPGYAEPRDPGYAEPRHPGYAEPRDPGYAEPRHPGYAEPRDRGYAAPASYVGAVPASYVDALPAGYGYAEPAVGSARPEAFAAPAAPAAPIRTAQIPAMPGAVTARGAAPPSSRSPGRAGRGYPPLSLAELEWHHDYPADEAHPRWQISGKPSRRIHSLVVALNPARAWRARSGRQAAPRQDREHREELMVLGHARAGSAGAMNSTRR